MKVSRSISAKQVSEAFGINENIDKFVDNSSWFYPIEKKNGDIRYIFIANNQLKAIQSWILENILEDVKISDAANAYVSKKSIFTNAQCHVGYRGMIKLDIMNFFDAINRDDISKIFENLGFSKDVAMLFGKLCSNKNILNQGFSTSPMLSNIFFYKYDKLIEKILNEKYGKNTFVYTRYSDDITISTSKTITFDDLMKLSSEIENLLLPKFKINKMKKKIILGKYPAKVTGINVFKEYMSVSKKIRRRIKREIHYCEKFGVSGHLKYVGEYNRQNFFGYLRGTAHFIGNTDKKLALKLLERIDMLEFRDRVTQKKL